MLLGLLVAVVAMTIVARAINVPYPILLVLGGLVLGAVPGDPGRRAGAGPRAGAVPAAAAVRGCVLLLAARPAPNLRPISMLAIGLVGVTMCAVAVVAHAVIDGLPWSVAFALGAIVAPTDPLAATTIARRLGVPRRLVTVIEGESLINDATALVAYRVAVAAAVGGGFSAWKAGPEFVCDRRRWHRDRAVIGWLVAEMPARLEDPPLEVTISPVTAYAAYLPAEALGASGVLAAVTTGIVLGWRAPDIAVATARMQGVAVWDTLSFVAQRAPVHPDRPAAARSSSTRSRTARSASWSATRRPSAAAVVGTRLLWRFTVVYVTRALDSPGQARRAPAPLARAAGRRLERHARRGLARGRAGAAARDRRRRGPPWPRPGDLPHLRGHPRHARGPGPDAAVR